MAYRGASREMGGSLICCAYFVPTRSKRGSRILQFGPHPFRYRVCASEHAPRDPCRVLKRRHGLAEIVERGSIVLVERVRVIPLHPERELITLSENTSRHWQNFAQQFLGFFEAL